jgi:hypothetical protein
MLDAAAVDNDTAPAASPAPAPPLLCSSADDGWGTSVAEELETMADALHAVAVALTSGV